MKKIVTLLLCLICLLILTACGKKEPVETAEPLPVETADSLVYDNGSTTLRFTCQEGKWIWTDGPTFPLDDSTITQIIAELPDILTLKPESNAQDLSAYGLTETSRYLTLTGGEGSQTLYFGAQEANGEWYMCTADSASVYLIPDDFIQLLKKGIYDMAVLPDIPELTEEVTTFIGVSQSEENNTYLLQSGGEWKSSGRDVSATAQKILKELSAMTITRCVDYFPSNGVRELCGLAEGATTAIFKYMNSVGSESELVLVIGGEIESGEGIYIMVGDNGAIYSIPNGKLTTLLSLL